MACSNEYKFIPNPTSDETAIDLTTEKCARQFKQGDIFNLEGIASFDTWKVVGGTVLQDVDNPCKATLEILDNGNFKLSLLETKPGIGDVPFICFGKITSSGHLTYTYPIPVFVMNGISFSIIDMIKMNTCATVWANPGIKNSTLLFIGKFNGKKLVDEAKFMARINEPCPGGYFEKLEPINSNLHYTFGHDLKVIDTQK